MSFSVINSRIVFISNGRLGIVDLRVQRSVVVGHCRNTGDVFQNNFISSRILNDIAVILLFCVSCNQGRVGSRNHIVSTNTYIIPSRIVLTGLDIVRFAINGKASNICCTVHCFDGFHFRASSYIKSGGSIAEIDFDVFAIRTTMAGNRNATTYFMFAFILARCRVVLAAANEVDGAAISLSCRLNFFNRVTSYSFTVVIYLFQCLVELTNGHIG